MNFRKILITSLIVICSVDAYTAEIIAGSLYNANVAIKIKNKYFLKYTHNIVKNKAGEKISNFVFCEYGMPKSNMSPEGIDIRFEHQIIETKDDDSDITYQFFSRWGLIRLDEMGKLIKPNSSTEQYASGFVFPDKFLSIENNAFVSSVQLLNDTNTPIKVMETKVIFTEGEFYSTSYIVLFNNISEIKEFISKNKTLSTLSIRDSTFKKYYEVK